MSLVSAAPAPALAAPSVASVRPELQSPWRAPLVPVALAFSLGIVIDRLLSVRLEGALLAMAVCLFSWIVTRRSENQGLALFYLWGAVASFGALYHRWYRDEPAEDDIRHFAKEEPRLVRLRGEVASDPTFVRGPKDQPLRGYPREDYTRVLVRATQLLQNDWRQVSGLVQVTVPGKADLEYGARIEWFGQLALPQGPANPGEFDYAAHLRDQCIGALVAVRKSRDSIVVLEAGSHWSIGWWRAKVRGWGNDVLDKALPEEEAALARELLLGDGAMTHDEWDKYIKTGVVHVLAISGQHLAVLAAFAWIVLRLKGARRRNGAIAVALFLLAYALLTGARPPVMRSAWTALVVCGGFIVTRPVMLANSFALAWLFVALWNPTDIFTYGCQLSFLAVAVLFWGVSSLQHRQRDPMEALIDEARPSWLRAIRWIVGLVALSFLVNLAVWVAGTPLVASRQHLISPIALLIGPPLILLTSIAILAGFLLLFCAPVLWPLAVIFAFVTRWSLRACTLLVDVGLHVPGAYWYVADVAVWWLIVFYAGLVACLFLPSLRTYGRWSLLAGLTWLTVWLVADMLPRPATEELRCTFLAVGHGGCTVLETPDGRVLLYDAGAMGGPDVTRRQIAPFLWYKGIRRIDEVFLSHADLDHFNGLVGLMERFAIGQVTCTPTFKERQTAAVAITLKELERHGIALRIVSAGQRLSAGEVGIEVLHPPRAGPDGNENARSLVLRIDHEDHSMLLTGDLEGAGLERVLQLPPQPVDVLMAPHHGSPASNIPHLAAWASPKVVISCQGQPRGLAKAAEVYQKKGARFLATRPHGAIMVTSRRAELSIQTFATQKMWKVE